MGSKLKDMNNKILQAMAESRKTVVRLLTETVSDGGLSFDQRLDLGDLKSNSSLLETKASLLNLKDSPPPPPTPPLSRPSIPSLRTSRLAESVNEIQPKHCSNAFILESLTSGISEG